MTTPAIRGPVVHPTAIVSPEAALSAGVTIGPYVLVEDGVEIGADCSIGAFSVLKSGTLLGPRNTVAEHCVLGGPPQDLGYQDTPTWLRIGTGNTFREHVTVHRSRVEDGETIIGDDNYLMVGAHLAHDCRVGDRTVLANRVGAAGFAEIEDDAVVGGAAQIHQHVRVGRFSMIGGVAAVRQDVVPYTLVAGHPGRTTGLNIVGLRRAGFTREQLHLLRHAYSVLFRSGGLLQERLRRLRELDSPHVEYMVHFTEASQRGLCRARGRLRQAAPEEAPE